MVGREEKRQRKAEGSEKEEKGSKKKKVDDSKIVKEVSNRSLLLFSILI